MNTFAVAKHTGKRVHVDECSSNRSVKYAKGSFCCIDCGKDVFIRRGEHRSWHFCHYSKANEQRCPHANGGETKEHYDAKHFVAKNLSQCAFLIEKCPTCKRKKFFVCREQGKHLCIHKCRAEVERRIDGTSRVADVAAISPNTGKVVAAIEIFHTHEVDQAKRVDCARQGIAVLEVTTEEVMRFFGDSLKSNRGLQLQLKTTGMRAVHCVECILYLDFIGQVDEVAEYERWHTSLWQQPHFRKPKRVPIPNEHRLCKAHGALHANESWYNWLWEAYGNLLSARMKDEALQQYAASMRRRAIDDAHKKIQEAELLLPRGYRKRKERCTGKCRQCGRWMFEGDKICQVDSCTMTEEAWDTLFEDEDPKYRRRYMVREEHNTLSVHQACTMECPECGDPGLLHQLARYGMCYACNTLFRERKTMHETHLRNQWARNGHFDLLLSLK